MRIQIIVRTNKSEIYEFKNWETLQVKNHNDAREHCLHVQKDMTLQAVAYIVIEE